MKKIAVISGKGGTGKTVLTGALAACSSSREKVLADCDVDAADLHLLLSPSIKERHDFRSGRTAVINKEKCVQCGQCLDLCRYGAILNDFQIDSVACEGCSFCFHACPVGAIRMETNESGEWYVSSTRFGPLVHARLGIAEENSGKLVSQVRKVAESLAEKEKSAWIIIDGPPGIGCPVIASLSGVDMALVVTEPTLSGEHDARRVIEVARHFNVPVKLVINKYTLNKEMTSRIEDYCQRERVPLVGEIPFDRAIVDTMVAGKTILEKAPDELKNIIHDIWDNL